MKSPMKTPWLSNSGCMEFPMNSRDSMIFSTSRKKWGLYSGLAGFRENRRRHKSDRKNYRQRNRSNDELLENHRASSWIHSEFQKTKTRMEARCEMNISVHQCPSVVVPPKCQQDPPPSKSVRVAAADEMETELKICLSIAVFAVGVAVLFVDSGADNAGPSWLWKLGKHDPVRNLICRSIGTLRKYTKHCIIACYLAFISLIWILPAK